ncbi:MAG: EscU/YscU/HrcU family type III secretion system export apparatus switch protein [Fimbriimonadaceae bacterium]|nr:EscU/YscU/HrcU family type III secretion system export apparatus switch protein [Fimbriimonadaceae bacterium]
MSSTAGERTEKPTHKRRQEARKRGQVARSNDLTGALLVLASSFAIPQVCRFLLETATEGAARAGSAPEAGLQATLSWWAMRASVGLFAPLAVLALVATVVVSGQVGVHFHSEGLKPKWERVNPLQGFKRLFSKHAAVEGLKALVKLALLGSTTSALVKSEWPRIAGMGGFGAGPLTSATIDAVQTLTVRFGIVWLAIGILDYVFQRYQVEKQMMMTKDELKREMREMEGSPELKSAQMHRRRKLAKGGMATRLKQADVLITNPTHYAIAVEYDRSTMHAPVILAKGKDYLALKMREIAHDVDLPIVENRAIARALFERCEAGDAIPRDLFLPVAELLAYVYKTFRRAKQ